MDFTAFIEILACLCAASFHFAAGPVVGFSAILIPQLESPDSDFKVTKEEISWLASVVALLIPVGALLCGYLVDRIGRLNTIRVAMLPYMVGWGLIAVSKQFSTMMVGRMLTAVAIAVGSNPGIVYITEVARPDYRGALTCISLTLVLLGSVVVYIQGAFLHWRTIAWISLSYGLFPVLFSSLWSPESPVWLVSKVRNQEAHRSLKYFLRKDKKKESADQQLSDLVKSHNRKQRGVTQEGSSFTKLFRGLVKPTGLKPLLILTVIFVFQQFSGCYVTVFYTVSLFEDVGSSINPHVSTVGVAVVRMIMGFFTSFLFRRFGRRPLFIISSAGMAIFIFISGYLTKQISEGNMEKNIAPVICIWLYMTVSVVGFMNIPWTMTAELFPQDIRGMAQGIMMAIAHLLMFAILKIYPFLGDMLGGMYMVQWMFAAVSFASIFFIFLFLPETHKKHLSEIEAYFAHNTVYILRDKTEIAASMAASEETLRLNEQPTKEVAPFYTASVLSLC